MSLDSASSQKDAGGAPAAGPMHQVMGRRWMVAAGHPLAAQAAARILEAGGNAIDAGCAAGFMLGVVHPDMVSFAGVAPILVHLGRTGETFEVSGVGPYPKRATAEYFHERCGGPDPRRPAAHGRAGRARRVVRGARALGHQELRRGRGARHGVRGARLPALRLLRVPVRPRTPTRSAKFPTSAALYLQGRAGPPPGQLLVEAELARRIKPMAAAE